MNTHTFQDRVNTLIQLSVDRHKNAFTRFDWPQSVSEDAYWFSPDALSVAGTEWAQRLDDAELQRLSKWECINSFSLNVTGERELMHEVSRVMHELPIGESRDYLHHLIHEENQHMWYFNKFCHTYAGKVYPNKKMPLAKINLSKSVDHFLVFARILIFEEIGHYHNIMNSRDDRVEPFVREINHAHYQEEARHITFGRKVLEPLAETALQNADDQKLILDELNKTLQMNIGSLYNPAMYRDAGLPKPMALRAELMSDPQRLQVHQNDILKGVAKVFGQLELPVNTAF